MADKSLIGAEGFIFNVSLDLSDVQDEVNGTNSKNVRGVPQDPLVLSCYITPVLKELLGSGSPSS